MADAVEHHLRYRALTVHVLIARFVIDCARKAFERLAARGRSPLEEERHRRGVRAACHRDLGIDLERLLGRDLLIGHRRRSRGCGMRGRIGRGVRHRHASERHRGNESQQADPDRLARIGVDESAAALFPANRLLAQAVERPGKGQCLIHSVVICLTNTVISIAVRRAKRSGLRPSNQRFQRDNPRHSHE
jgi:hypothetical protein